MIFQAGIVSKWTYDSQRFLLEHFETIKTSPSHIYHSALPFSPSSSLLHKCYSIDPLFSVKVAKGLPAEWGKCSRTVSLGSFTQTLSYWNNTVAVGSRPGDIIILDTITGNQTAVLSGHTHEVNCVTFSSDGTSLVSGSHDKTVKLWDVQTGGVVKTFSGYTSVVWSVSISADCTMIASGSGDETVCLWDIQKEECQCVIRQQSIVYHVIFSPTNPQHLISICNDKLWQWDTDGHQISPPSVASCVAFSPNGTQFVLCYWAVVTVQNSGSGATVAKFQVNGNAQCCCFSLDGRLVAVAAGRVIYVWDITGSDPYLVETLIGHTEYITSLAFSSPSTLISASEEKSVKFWQISASSTDLAATDSGSTPILLPLVSSISLQARDGIAISSDTDGVVKTWDIPASLCKASSESPAEDYKDGDVRLINSKLVFVWYRDGKLNIWDPEKGKYLLQADVPENKLLDLRISGDRSKLFFIHEFFTQAWDMWTGEAMGKTPRAGFTERLIAMSGSRVWKVDSWEDVSGWEFGITGSPPVGLSTQPPSTLHLNNTKLWDNKQCRIQDIVTGKVVFQLPEQFKAHVEVQWNGQYLVISPKSEMELILELPSSFLQ